MTQNVRLQILNIFIANELFTVSTEVALDTTKVQAATLEKRGSILHSKRKESIIPLKALLPQIPIEDQLNIKIEEELIFPTESVVKFPATIGITGEIFTNGGITY